MERNRPMTQYHHNQKVTCTIEGSDIKDARISIGKNGWPHICHNDETCCGAEADDLLGYEYSWGLDKDFTSINVTNLKSAEPETWIPKEGEVYFVAHNDAVNKFIWRNDDFGFFRLGIGRVFKTDEE